ncbi:protein pop-1 [Eurytemora carolleeae]|uniref:protein pop-1 n=1 Tax=Eurytemora carolleeae TaxID=1294199 RepID=UPI000C77CDDE|nr:protein pop-1 [Eurytemora carolleeae]|eukprot:XP_023348384.1 protein pop-1-like [Eurytemora affinis]
MQMYPGWSARDNYAQSKEPKKKRKRDKIADNSGIPMKKCRARYGLDQNELWCKPCKPEEAIDGVDDNMPMFSMSGHGNMGDITQSPPHNLVSISEPLLDLRNYSQMSCSLIGTGLGSSCSGGHESADLSGLSSDPTGQSPKYICL